MITIHYDPQEKQYLVDPDSPELRAVISVIRAWPSLLELVEFARKRHGYGNSDGGFGILYPEDLDGYDREEDGIVIPKGHVQVYGFWGPPEGYEYNLPEATYLEVLIGVLRSHGLEHQAKHLKSENPN